MSNIFMQPIKKFAERFFENHCGTQKAAYQAAAKNYCWQSGCPAGPLSPRVSLGSMSRARLDIAGPCLNSGIRTTVFYCQIGCSGFTLSRGSRARDER
jgi:hypothetical protein